MTLSHTLLAALLAGLLGSWHCAAMCGPLAVAGCARGGAPGYFGARFVSYAFTGALMGHLGRHALCILPVARAQRYALALVALPVAIRGLQLLLRRPRPDLVQLGTTPRPHPRRRGIGSLLPTRGAALGLVTGFLPCGMLVAAWALAAGTLRPERGALVMITFAAASLPGLLIPLLGLSRLRLSPRVQGLAWCALALWLAARPLLMSAHHH